VTRKDKRLARIRANPKQVRFEQMAGILEHAGFEMRRSRRGTSHCVFFHDGLDQVVVLVSHGQDDLLPDYQVRKALAALDRLSALEAEGDDDG
jgi:predicted RNA binding protein YcfA (HicA-like mRNA interferase family)